MITGTLMETKFNLYPDGDRKTLFEEALKYQDFVVDLLLKELGVVVSNYSSKYYQFNYGESRQGVEIKMDLRSDTTGNISIEVAEKSRANILVWTPSGIMREDNTWLYVQGSYKTVYIFGKSILRLLYNTKYKDLVWEPKTTIRTFLMPLKDADRYCLKKIEVNHG